MIPINFNLKQLPNQPPEIYYGNKEYKQELSNMDSNKIEKYATQMKFRLLEGKGKAIYFIGVQDDGNIIGVPNGLLKKYLNIIKQICNKINSSVYKISYIETQEVNYSIMIINIKANFNLESIFYLTGDV